MASTAKRDLIRFIFGSLSLIGGLFFLYKSSLSKMQFGKAKTVKTIVFVSLSPLFLLLLMAWKSNPILAKLHHLNRKEAIVNSFFFAVICLLMFWIKNPGFGIHYSQHQNYSCVSQQVKTLSRGNAYNLFAVVTFSFLPLIVAWKRKQTIELGYFSILLGLTMEYSMEIQGTYGPNLLYILVAAFYCIGLLFSRSFLKSLIEKRTRKRRSSFVARLAASSLVENCLASLLIAVGTILLSKGSFFQDQFEGITKWAGVFFLIMFPFLLLLLVVKAPTAINMVAKACHRNYVMKAIINCCLLAFVSGVNFLKKYPKFKMQSMIVQSCFQQQNGNVVSFGSDKFDLYSAGLFALFSLIVASARQQPVELGISSFLLELTMDASIEMFGNDHRTKFGYLLCASFYCVFLIFMRGYHDSKLIVKNYTPPAYLIQEVSDILAALENMLLKYPYDIRALLQRRKARTAPPLENTLEAPLNQEASVVLAALENTLLKYPYDIRALLQRRKARTAPPLENTLEALLNQEASVVLAALENTLLKYPYDIRERRRIVPTEQQVLRNL